MKKHIHIFGASGSGTTSIAKEAAARLGYAHIDTDEYYWMPTDEPFTVKREPAERVELMLNAMNKSECWINSGSLMGWGRDIVESFDLVVFVYVPNEIRMERLKKREYERYGDRILKGGDHYQHTVDFLEWASGYEDDTFEGRSLKRHRQWLEGLSCTVIEVENIDFENSVEMVIKAIEMEK